MTGSAVAVGAAARCSLFGAFTTYHLRRASQTQLVQRTGHLTVFRTGYFLFGAGNPAAYGIADYQDGDAS